VKLTEIARLTTFFTRVARDPRTQRPHPDVEERLDVDGRGGCRYDLYRPHQQPRGLVVAVHGLTPHGNRDVRLVHFARCLARMRVACAVPVLPGLVACGWRADDLDALTAATIDAAEGVGCAPGLIGFSFGGGYSLLAASRAPLADRVRFVVTFGAHHSLRAVFESYLAARQVTTRTAAGWDDWIYLNLALAETLGSRAGLSEPICAEAHALLLRFCHDATAEEKRRFYDQHLVDFVGLEAVDACLRRSDPQLLDQLSPAGRLGGLHATVSLIHDEQDYLVPVAQLEPLQREVAAVVGADRCRALATTMLSQALGGRMPRLGEIGRLYSALAPLVTDAV
jgi:pimeloyl-ACP methyl ester carboxylesterase